ncbi:undecaprenyldiphospho-muramoylpentapeptide beta-N-acetylglucosaminyltransferase [Tunicatimonas pelagia]|uniref:undecaprenyldiphospho-muramoylpentapeptide beta-N-acetylglucosaminyltransferase n=1 Tax=Tunicatimonas pelagia TaxID=931531 RepID=UPI0026666D6A|nr:undecaprenyldiphospho-muramoylpentapeptide beta-N-acetylglucosaminyltransferase [Tunicatimonas pelagia]WKN41366.1 undecaprenyldiphospho-muramoylpentapeptide beta-N-acetylglucosaminyltransferase [Tunicatimonas pelagia]
MAERKPYRVIISGGGTGGHIYPAIAIANALRSMHSKTEILFVGADGRMEMQKVPEAGYAIEGLWISGLQRKLTADNLLFPAKVISSSFKANQIINAFKPQAAVGVGGFASGPLVYVASLRRVPSLLQEQNSYAGLTNKMLASQVSKICVAHPGMEKFFPAEKLVFTGNPIRKEIVELAQQKLDERKAEAIEYFGLNPQKKTLLVIGGSLGARTLNESVINNIQALVDANVQVIWQSGKYYYQKMKEQLSAIPDHDSIQLREFLNRMDLAYSVADVVISRAGALSISELALVQKPVIFVPSPNVAEDHQRKNAEALVRAKAALMITDAEAPGSLVEQTLALLADESQQQQLQQNIQQWARPEAAEHIAQEVVKLIEEKP